MCGTGFIRLKWGLCAQLQRNEIVWNFPNLPVHFLLNLTLGIFTCGPPLILSPALKRWGPPPRRQGLCSHPAHWWAISDFVPRFEAVGTPEAVGVMEPPGPLVGHL